MKEINGIILNPDNYPNLIKWITLGSGAGINQDALVNPLTELGTGTIIGCQAGFYSDP